MVSSVSKEFSRVNIRHDNNLFKFDVYMSDKFKRSVIVQRENILAIEFEHPNDMSDILIKVYLNHQQYSFTLFREKYSSFNIARLADIHEVLFAFIRHPYRYDNDVTLSMNDYEDAVVKKDVNLSK